MKDAPLSGRPIPKSVMAECRVCEKKFDTNKEGIIYNDHHICGDCSRDISFKYISTECPFLGTNK